MNQDRELFKLQVAAQSYESDLEMSFNYFVALIAGVLVLTLGAVLSKQLPYFVSALAFFAALLIGGFYIWGEIGKYHKAMEGLDEHLKNLEKGQPAPSITELIED